jgi:type I restriction enzyme S subunit
MAESYPQAPLGTVLRRSIRPAEVDPSKTYKQIVVRMHNAGLALRGHVNGDAVLGRQFFVSSGQFLVARIGAGDGAVGLVPPELDGAIVTSDFWAFECDGTRLLPDFLQLYGGTATFTARCAAASSGTTRLRLQEGLFLKIPIPLPPIAEQGQIVSRVQELSAKIDEICELRREAALNLITMQSAVLRQVIAEAKAHEGVLQDACAAIIDNLHCNPVYSDDGVPCIRSPDVGWGTLHLDRALRTTEQEFLRRTVRGEPIVGDVVFVREGGGTGKAAVVQEGQRFSLGQRVMILRPDSAKVISKFFLYQLLSPPVYHDQIVPLCKGSASPHLNISTLRRFRFRLPGLPEQRRIVAYLDDLQGKVDAFKRLQAETAADLDAMLPSILDKAFKGEL